MKKEIIYQKNYIFFCSVILPFIQSFDFLLAVTKSLERPVKKLIPNHSPVGCLIISNHIEKKGSNFFIERLNDNLLFNLYGALKTKLAQKKFLNEITIEIDNFIFKFELLKYEIPSRPNLSWVTIQDLEKIYENEVIQPIVDLKIIMGLLPNTVLHLSFLR